MASGTIKGTMTGSYGVEIDWSSVSNVEANTSEFTMKTYVLHPYMNISGRTGSTTIDGSTASYKTGARKADDARWLVNTRTVTIQHEDDGTKEFNVSASFPFDLDSSSHGRIRTKTASGKVVLDNIPRASEVSTQTASVKVNGSNKWSVTMNRHSTAFWHKATLTFGVNTVTTDPFQTTGEYTIPVYWLHSMTTTQKGTVSVSIQTYSDSSCNTAIGDPTTGTFEITVPDDAKPTISDGWAKVEPYNADAGYIGPGSLSVYVQGRSKAQVIFDTSKVTANYNADIKETKISWDGSEVKETPYRTKVLSKSGKQMIRCTVTDTRGLSNYVDLEINVEAYSKPTLSGISIYRCNSGGEADDTGAFIYFKATANIASCAGQNGYWMSAYWEPTTSSTWQNQTSLTGGTGSIIGAGAVSATTSYNAHILMRDYFNNTASFTVLIPTADASFNLKRGGKGGAFGKYAEKDGLLDVAWDIHSDGAISGENGYRLDKLAISKAYADTEIGGGFAAFGASHVPTVYRAGPHVYLRGIVKATAKLSASSDMYTLFTLPAWARPAGFIDTVGQGSTTAITWLRIAPDGTVTIGRYRSGDTYLDIETNYQLTLYAAWIAADATT